MGLIAYGSKPVPKSQPETEADFIRLLNRVMDYLDSLPVEEDLSCKMAMEELRRLDSLRRHPEMS